MKIIYNIPNIIRMAGMERILAIKANYLAGLTGMEVVVITYEQKNLPLAFDFSDKIRFYDLDIDYEKEMARIQAEMKEVLEQEKKSQQMLEDAFRGIGYGID
mgnify:CR=1 FL=1